MDSTKVHTTTKDKEHDYSVQSILEISALKELLSRVIAEKNRLEFENSNLKTLLVIQSDNTTICPVDMPSRINDMDRMIDTEHRKYYQENQPNPNVSCQGDKTPSNNRPLDTALEEELPQILIKYHIVATSKPKIVPISNIWGSTLLLQLILPVGG